MKSPYRGKATFRRVSGLGVGRYRGVIHTRVAGRFYIEVFGPQEADGDDAISGLWRFFNELDVTWPVQAVLSS